MVGVHVSDEEGARRELERGDRHPGWNRGSARAAHADAEYDFELDTTATPVHELARSCMRAIKPARTPWLSTGYANASYLEMEPKSCATGTFLLANAGATRHRALGFGSNRRPRGSCGTLHPTRRNRS